MKKFKLKTSKKKIIFSSLFAFVTFFFTSVVAFADKDVNVINRLWAYEPYMQVATFISKSVFRPIEAGIIYGLYVINKFLSQIIGGLTGTTHGDGKFSIFFMATDSGLGRWIMVVFTAGFFIAVTAWIAFVVRAWFDPTKDFKKPIRNFVMIMMLVTASPSLFSIVAKSSQSIFGAVYNADTVAFDPINNNTYDVKKIAQDAFPMKKDDYTGYASGAKQNYVADIKNDSGWKYDTLDVTNYERQPIAVLTESIGKDETGDY
ncbi:MAG: hypothetical protein LBV67_06270, partial [Streptococcaceae bacterium]|nr:hypothetical protein [Streptococcaceae bacterium]